MSATAFPDMSSYDLRTRTLNILAIVADRQRLINTERSSFSASGRRRRRIIRINGRTA